jgi:hypothetical protein
MMFDVYSEINVRYNLKYFMYVPVVATNNVDEKCNTEWIKIIGIRILEPDSLIYVQYFLKSHQIVQNFRSENRN